MREKRKWKKLDLLRKLLDLRWKRESRLKSLKEKEKLKNIDKNKSA